MAKTREFYAEAMQRRWLEADEVLDVLTNHTTIGCVVSLSAPDAPPSGSVYLYDRRRTKRFRRDGHNWVTRKSAGRIREDHVKLRINGSPRVSAAHAHSADSPSFHRRTYLLLSNSENTLDAAALALVHYRHSEPPTEVSREAREREALEQEERDLLGAVLNGDGDDDDLFSPKVDSSLNMEDLCANLISDEHLDEESFRGFGGLTNEQLQLQPQRQDLPLRIELGAVDAMRGVAHAPSPLAPLAVEMQPCALAVVAPLTTSLLHYAPEVLVGGLPSTKLILVFNAELRPCRLDLLFRGGNVMWSHDVERLGPHTACCTLPALDGRVEAFRVVSLDEDLVVAEAPIRVVEAAAREVVPLPIKPDDDMLPDKPRRTRMIKDEEEDDDDDDPEKMPAAELDAAVEKLMLRVVGQMSRLATTEKELAEELDAPDRNGLGLVHYCAMYNLAELIQDLIAKGASADGDVESSQKAPLHLAARAGHQSAARALVEGGADVSRLDSEGRTPRALALHCGHLAMAEDLLQAEQRPPASKRTRLGGFQEKVAVISPEVTSSARDMTTQCNTDPTELPFSALLHTAFSSLSLHEKCALKIVASRANAQQQQALSSSPEKLLLSPLLAPALVDPSSNSNNNNNMAMLNDLVAESTTPALPSPPASPPSSPPLRDAEELRAEPVEDSVSSKALSVISDSDSLDVAMSMMDASEISELEDEARVITTNVKAWIVRRHFVRVREAARMLEQRWNERRKRGGNNNNSRRRRIDNPTPPLPPPAASLPLKRGRGEECLATVPEHETAPNTQNNNSDDDEQLLQSVGNVVMSERGTPLPPPPSSSSCSSNNNPKSEDEPQEEEEEEDTHPAAAAANLKLQAASRGMLARRQLSSLKGQMLALLVASRNFRENSP